MLGLLLLVPWAYRRIARGPTEPKANVVRVALIIYLISVLVSYLVAVIRPINGTELNAADRGVLSTLAWTGILLTALDAPRTLGQLDTILRRFVIAGAVEAAVGITQFVTKQTLVNYIQIPGLTLSQDLYGVALRGTQARPPGTTTHPIEFGSVLTIVLPFALHYAVTDTHRGRLARWLPAALIAFAIPISVSRSAVLSTAVSLIVLIPFWPRATRRRAYAGIALALGAVYMLVPGLLGTFRNLITGVESDPSANSRVDSFGLAWEFIKRDPIFGRGYATFLPDYRILDNQILGTLIDTGIVGLIALLVLFVAPAWGVLRLRRTATTSQVRQLAPAFVASIAGVLVSYPFWDALGFTTATSFLFMTLGFAGALVRLSRAESGNVLRPDCVPSAHVPKVSDAQSTERTPPAGRSVTHDHSPGTA